MIVALLRWIAARRPVALIYDAGRPYLQRFHLVLFERLGFRVYLHRFIGSDPDRGLHDHPWAWALTLILSGWYFEERRDGTRARRWGYLIPSGDVFHRVVLPKRQREVWSLFVHGPYVKHWGFIRPALSAAERAGRVKVWPHWGLSRGGEWSYAARPRDAERFSHWHEQPGVLRGRAVLARVGDDAQ